MKIQTLLPDPNGYRINCCSFQQDALVTFGHYQYVALYTPLENSVTDRTTCIGRKHNTEDSWSFVYFTDYIQSKDDGHNVISMGISGDGTIHMAWDMHGDEIHYRKSIKGLAAINYGWDVASFTPVLNHLESETVPFIFDEITYPRFQPIDTGDLLLEFREGRSGLGDCCLYRYSIETCKWHPVAAPYIKGVENNAYLHGFDFVNGVIHVTWTYRDFVDDRSSEVGKGTSQAGPNGPENNHDLHYMYSNDYGVTWFNTKDEPLQVPVDISQDTLVVEIPKFSGIMNQEGQAVDPNGGVHVLGRENSTYYYYYRNPVSSAWSRKSINSLQAPLFGARGKVLWRENSIYALLPLPDYIFSILRSDDLGNDWTIVHELKGYDGEPLVDKYAKGISILQRESHTDSGTSNVVVLDMKTTNT